MFRIINFQFALITFKHIYIFKHQDNTVFQGILGAGGTSGGPRDELIFLMSSNSLACLPTNKLFPKNSTLLSPISFLYLTSKHNSIIGLSNLMN